MNPFIDDFGLPYVMRVIETLVARNFISLKSDITAAQLQEDIRIILLSESSTEVMARALKSYTDDLMLLEKLEKQDKATQAEISIRFNALLMDPKPPLDGLRSVRRTATRRKKAGPGVGSSS